MKRGRLLIALITTLVMCLFLSGCELLALAIALDAEPLQDNSTFESASSENKEAEKTEGSSSIKSGGDSASVKNNTKAEYSFIDEDSTKDESIIADQVFELIVSDANLKSDTSFSSLGYDVSEEDALVYAKSLALIGDSTHVYNVLSYLGYRVDRNTLATIENYSKAKTLIRKGNHTEAYHLLCKNLDYADSKKLAEEMVNQKLVNFSVGGIGPAGGYIFYDKGSYSDGWRYLEAAPADLFKDYQYGEYKENGTSTTVGTGKSNTEAIVNKVGSGKYAAKACADYTYNGYDDWFLPSKAELNLMYTNLHKKGRGHFNDSYYWSSSEASSYFASWEQSFYNGSQYTDGRYNYKSVRPARMF